MHKYKNAIFPTVCITPQRLFFPPCYFTHLLLLDTLAFFNVHWHVLCHLRPKIPVLSETIEANQLVLSRAFCRVPICIFDFIEQIITQPLQAQVLI